MRELDLWVKDLGKQVFVVCHEKGTHSEKTIEQIFHIDLNGALKYRCVFPITRRNLINSANRIQAMGLFHLQKEYVRKSNK